jgi:Ca2+/H+ antiporter
MEIGSAYALQVCLLQIPAMVAFSAWYNSANMGEVAKTFSYVPSRMTNGHFPDLQVSLDLSSRDGM